MKEGIKTWADREFLKLLDESGVKWNSGDLPSEYYPSDDPADIVLFLEGFRIWQCTDRSNYRKVSRAEFVAEAYRRGLWLAKQEQAPYKPNHEELVLWRKSPDYWWMPGRWGVSDIPVGAEIIPFDPEEAFRRAK